MAIDTVGLPPLIDADILTTKKLERFLDLFSDNRAGGLLRRLTNDTNLSTLPYKDQQVALQLFRNEQIVKQSLAKEAGTTSVLDQLKWLEQEPWIRQINYLVMAESHRDDWKYTLMQVHTTAITMDHQERRYQFAPGAVFNIFADAPRDFDVRLVHPNTSLQYHPYGTIGGISFLKGTRDQLAQMRRTGNVVAYVKTLHDYLTTYDESRLWTDIGSTKLTDYPSEPIAN